MEARKVQKVGASSLSVSLPKEWTGRHNVERGDLLFWSQESDGALRLIPSSLARHLTVRGEKRYYINVDADPQENLLEKLVIGNYVLGRDYLVIRSRKGLTAKQSQEVHRALARLMGIGVIEESATTMVLQCAIQLDQYSINRLLKRLQTVVGRMFNTLAETMSHLDPQLLQEVLDWESEVDRLYWLTLRLIFNAQMDPDSTQKVGARSSLELIGDRTVAKYLEVAGDHAEDIALALKELAKQGSNFEASIVKVLRRLITNASGILEMAVGALLTKDVKQANQAINLFKTQKDTGEILEEAIEKVGYKGEFANVARKVAWNISWIGAFGAGIAEVAINRYLEWPSVICEPIPDED